MAKKRNHYIPRVLLARFASRSKGKKAWVWQLRHGHEPIEVSIRDIAVASNFYGRPETGVEDLLAEQETRMRPVMDSIESGADPADYGDQLWHWSYLLAIRTRHLRDGFSGTASQMIDEMASSAESEAARSALVASVEANLDEAILDALEKLPKQQKEHILSVLEQDPDMWMKLQEYARQFVSRVDLGITFKKVLLEARAFIDPDEAAKTGHVKGLSRLLAAGESPSSIGIDSWHMIRRDSGQFVLGDCCVFGIDESRNPSPLLVRPEECREVYLPLSKQAMLVGTRGLQKPSLTASQINLATAKVSTDALFAGALEPSVLALRQSIGTASSLLGKRTINTLVEEVWQGIQQNPKSKKKE